MEILKKIASYFWDIPIVKSSSEQNQYLELVWSMGRKMLNTKNANYSFGNGYKVFKFAFEQVSEQVKLAGDVLILGFGCGSVLDLLEKKYSAERTVCAVEYDRKIIDLFMKYFESQYALKPELHHADAFEFMKENQRQFDLIIVDLFEDLNNISFVFDKAFTAFIVRALKQGAVLIYNTTKTQDKDNTFNELMLMLSKHFLEVRQHHFQEINRIIIANNAKMA